MLSVLRVRLRRRFATRLLLFPRMVLPVILGLVGRLGSGKTLLASWLASVESSQGRPVWANYALHCAQRLKSWSELVQLECGVVVLDEVHVEVDSRTFAGNVEATSFLLQTRKLDLDLIWTSQAYHQVDKRIRDITDLLGMCDRSVGADGSRASKVTLVDLASVQVLRRFVVPHTVELYSLYDTKARVFPLERPRRLGLSHMG